MSQDNKPKTTEELKRAIDKLGENIEYGSVKIQIREGKAVIMTVEKTVKLD